MTRYVYLRRVLVTTAAIGGGSYAITSGLAHQPIQLIEPVGTPAEGAPGSDRRYPATPEATSLEGTPVSCARGMVPAHIAIPIIGVDAEIAVLEMVGGAMQQPTDARDVAWYKETVHVGERGNTLLAGHLNDGGVPEGVFFRLARLQEGDAVELEGEDEKTYRYIVRWTEDFPSAQEPPPEALGQTDEEVITMITCGGEWHAGRAEYDHRTLVRAARDTGTSPATPAA